MVTPFHPRRPRGSLIVGMFVVKVYIHHESPIVPTIKIHYLVPRFSPGTSRRVERKVKGPEKLVGGAFVVVYS